MMMKLPINVFGFFIPKHKAYYIYGVTLFVSDLMPEIKCFKPELRKIYYFSDECVGQYKKQISIL